jgi:hypothetical protein
MHRNITIKLFAVQLIHTNNLKRTMTELEHATRDRGIVVQDQPSKT